MLSDLLDICINQERQLELHFFGNYTTVTVSFPREPFSVDVRERGNQHPDEIAADIIQQLIRRVS